MRKEIFNSCFSTTNRNLFQDLAIDLCGNHAPVFRNEQENRDISMETVHQNGFSGSGTTLATDKTVKNPITYRKITLAVGILVALVIVLTLWINRPGEKMADSGASTMIGMPSLAQYLFKTATAAWSGQ
jgi:hypothetical protein